jgi:hypothetical protein
VEENGLGPLPSLPMSGQFAGSVQKPTFDLFPTKQCNRISAYHHIAELKRLLISGLISSEFGPA